MRLFTLVAIVAAFFSCTVSGLAETAIPAKLSVTDAVSLALKNSPDLKQARENKLSSESALRVAGFVTSMDFGSTARFDRQVVPADNTQTTPCPSFINYNLSSLLKSSYNYNNFAGTQATLGFTPLGLGQNSTGLNLSLRQPILKGKGLLSTKGLAYKSAQSDLAITNKRAFLSEQATIQGVVEAYYQAVMASEEVKVREQAVKNAEIAADGWRKREAAGIAAGIDVTRSDVQVAQTKNQLNAQQRDARNALDKLMVAMGGGVGQTPELVDSVPTTTNVTLPPLGDAIKKALSNRVELDVFDERLADQQRQLSSAKDSLKPQFDLTAGFNGAGNSDAVVSRSVVDYGMFYTGLEYNIPLDQRVVREKRQNVTRQLDLLGSQRDFEMETITEEVRAAYRRVESTRASLDILAQNKISAEDNLRIANRMMEVGKGSSRDVLDAQLSVTEVDSSILSAKTDYFLATIDLKRTMGEDISTMEFK